MASSSPSSPGILLVTMRPHPSLPLPAFHAWYNNEHGPTRLSLPSIFSNGLRYHTTAAASSSPAYMAVYDVKHMPLLATPAYTTLRANRSPREAATIAQVDVRRSFYDLLHCKTAATFQPLESLTDREAAGHVTVAVEIRTSDDPEAGEEYRKWHVEEHVELLAKVPGWRRSRLFKTSTAAGEVVDEVVYLCLHEYEPTNGLGGAEHAASMDTPRRTAIFTKYVAAKDRTTYTLFYIFGPASRDLHSLSQLPASAASFTSGTLRTDTTSITSHITTSDNLIIPYRLEGNPAPDAPVVVFSNSLLTSYAMWDPLVALLTQQRPDLRILRYNTRGRHGVPQPHTSARLETVADDVEALRVALRIEKIARLVGVSMGGATTLRYALSHPTRVARFVAADFNCTSSAANTQAWQDRIAIARRRDGMRTLAGQTVGRWCHPGTSQDKIAWMTDMVADNDVEGFAHSCTALWDYDMQPEMPSCAVPGLLVVGEADGKGALVKAMEGFKGLLGHEGAELRVVPQAGHLPMCENPEGFWDAIKDFI